MNTRGKILRRIQEGQYQDYSEKKSELCQRRCPETCSWILEDKIFNDWRRDPKSCTLWLSSPVGSGKSVLSAYLVEYFQAPERNFPIVLYYFFGAHSKPQGPAAALLSMIRQLLLIQPRLCDYINYKLSIDKFFCENLDGLIIAFQESLRILQPSCVMLFIDGVDECENDPSDTSLERFLKAICNIVNLPCLKTFITSRPDIIIRMPELYRNIQYQLGISPGAEVTGKIVDDIGKFLRFQTGELVRKERLCGKSLAKVRNELERLPEIIGERAGSSFIIASASMEVFNRWADLETRSLADVKAKIKQIRPISLSETSLEEAKPLSRIFSLYSDILKSIPSEVVPKVARLFKWMAVYSGEALSLEEANIIIALEPNHNSNEELQEAVDPGTDTGNLIQQLCGPLVQIGRGTKTVQWFHISAREFVLSGGKQKNEGNLSYLRTTEDEAHQFVSIHCLAYLSFGDLPLPHDVSTTTLPRDEYSRKLLDKFPLLSYSSEFWGYHVRKSQKLLWTPDSREYVKKWIENSNGLKLAFDLYWDSKGLRMWDEYPKELSWLHLFAHFGLDLLIDNILKDHQDAAEGLKTHYDPNDEFKLKDGLSPTHLAAMRGHADVLHTLKKWQIQTGSGVQVTPLQLAIEYGNINITQAIIDSHDIDRDLGMPSDQALEYAALGGDIDLMELILAKYELNVNCKLPTHGNALEAAALRGHTGAVRYLIGRDADINGSCPGRFGHPLQAAAFSSFMEIIRILLDNGADVNAVGGEYHTALQSASLWGDPDLVLLLVQRGARDDKKGGPYGSALGAAEYFGYKDIVDILRENGATEAIHPIDRRVSTIDGGTHEILNRTAEQIGRGDMRGYKALNPGYESKIKRVIVGRNERRLDYYLKVAVRLFRMALKSGREEPLKLMTNSGMNCLQWAMKMGNISAAQKIARAWTEALASVVDAGKQNLVYRLLKQCVMSFKSRVEKENQDDAFQILRAGIEMLMAFSESENEVLLGIIARLWADALEDILEYRYHPEFQGLVLHEIREYATQFNDGFRRKEYGKCTTIVRAGIAMLDLSLKREHLKATGTLVSIFQPCADVVLKSDEIYSGSDSKDVQVLSEPISKEIIDKITLLAWRLAGADVAPEVGARETQNPCHTLISSIVAAGIKYAMAHNSLDSLEEEVSKVMEEELEHAKYSSRTQSITQPNMPHTVRRSSESSGTIQANAVKEEYRLVLRLGQELSRGGLHGLRSSRELDECFQRLNANPFLSD